MRYVLLLSLSSLFFACPDQVIAAEGCVLPGDCPDTQVCLDGECVEDDGTAPTCTPATEGEDCGVGAYCLDGRCATSPTCDNACPEGLICNAETNLCVRDQGCGECPNASFCDGVEVCNTATGVCEPGEPPCGANADRCSEETRSCGCLTSADCTAPETCNGDGVCECVRDCSGKNCGDDKCGGTCGSCQNGDTCDENGLCECVPDCNGRECGSDGCDSTCGSCDGNDSCNAAGQCECIPDCTGKVCGDDGCGGSCGDCGFQGECAPNGQCDCLPDCFDRECGDDGCGGTCGPTCAVGVCNANGQCNCTPTCGVNNTCGDDGCGGSCGDCGNGQACVNDVCENTGEVCDELTDPFTHREYQTQNGELNAVVDKRYVFDNRPERVMDNFNLDFADAAAEGSSVEVKLTGSFDTLLYIYRVDGNRCNQVARDDDGGEGTSSALSFSPVPGASYQAIITSFPGDTTGTFTLSTTISQCGAEFADQNAYDSCINRIRSPQFTCSNNPCLAGASPDFCCMNASCRADHDDEITVQRDPSGTCQ